MDSAADNIEIRRAEPADLAGIVALDFRNFGVVGGADETEIAGELLDLDRFLVAADDGELVAASGSFQMELTVPGGATVPMAGVTWVSVLASHRRRGILRRLMEGLDELADELEEPILGLQASEGPIYERFGYGIATRCRVVELDRRRTAIDPRFNPEPVKLVYAADHVEEMLACYDRYRLTQPGEVSRSEALFRDQNIERNKPDFAALHPDGYAIWEIEPNWHNGHPAHVLRIKDLVAVTPEANLALWNILLSIDLVGPIRSIRTVAVDDALPFFLTDQRALRTVESNDYLWLKVTEMARCFDARSYRVDDRLVIGVVEDQILDGAGDGDHAADDRHRFSDVVSVGPGGCRAAEQPVDLIATRAALGPLLLGVSASGLAAGHRVRAEPAVLERADALFGTGRSAHCRTSF